MSLPALHGILYANERNRRAIRRITQSQRQKSRQYDQRQPEMFNSNVHFVHHVDIQEGDLSRCSTQVQAASSFSKTYDSHIIKSLREFRSRGTFVTKEKERLGRPEALSPSESSGTRPKENGAACEGTIVPGRWAVLAYFPV